MNMPIRPPEVPEDVDERDGAMFMALCIVALSAGLSGVLLTLFVVWLIP